MEEVNIRSLQHYLYCPHRWGLLEIEQAWAENYFVVKANIAHERVHSGDDRRIGGKRVFNSVKVWNDEYGLFGVLDSLEEKDGAYTIVEYKPSKPDACDIRTDDAIQLYAQKKCVDRVFNCDCKTQIYYTKEKQKVTVSFADTGDFYDELLRSTLDKIRSLREKGIIPQVPEKQNCSGCSMKDLCIPSAFKKTSRLRKEISAVLKGDT